MRPFKARYVTLCQQMLVLAAVLAVLTPATAVISMEVVERAPATTQAPATQQPAPPGARQARTTRDAQPAAERRAPAPQPVVEESVEPVVTEVPIAETTDPVGERSTTERAPDARRTTPQTDGDVVLSQPQPVTGYGAVGITWSSASQVDEHAISFEVRSEQDGAWSAWEAMDYHEEEAPDPESAEGQGTRPGTDAVVVGDVDRVQVRVTSASTLPDDLELAVVDPGTPTKTVEEEPAIDTGAADGKDLDTLASDQGDLALQATTFTQKPQIFSRAQWGADESLRDRGSLRYFEVHAGFVHHTVTSNSYTREQVPSIIRGIYAYHTRSRGWSDIGYNFLVDRFGRIWEGRYGGVDRPVVGARTLGYNDYSFAMSAIGNYDIARPSDAMIQAYGRLFAWKLSLHGVDASSTSQRVGTKTFQAINGHRDAGSTACPGRYLYAQLPTIRSLAAQTQQDWKGRELADNLVGNNYPDLIVRRASDGRVFTLPTGGGLSFAPTTVAAAAGYRGVAPVAMPDITGDGFGDVLARRADGQVELRPGNGLGGFGAATRVLKVLDGTNLLAYAGDLNGDGRPDLVARAADGTLRTHLGSAPSRFTRGPSSRGWGAYDVITGGGDFTGDGNADLVVRTGDTLVIRPGNGRGGFGAARAVPGSFGQYDVMAGGGDLTRDRRADLFVRHRTTRQAWVLTGRGDGTFGAPVGPVGLIRGLTQVSVAQVQGGRGPDVVAVSGDRLVVRAHRGRFSLGRPVNTGLTLPAAVRLMNVGDWDRDGHNDLLVRTNNGTLDLHRGRGNGTFEAARRIASGFGSVGLLAAVGDMTGDGLPDLMGQPKGAAMRIYPGNGLAGLKTSYVAYTGIKASRQVGIGRWNGDGSPDSLFRSGSTLRWYPGNGPGGLTKGNKQISVDLSAYDWVLGVSDIAGRGGHADLLVREKGTGHLYVLPATEAGVGARRILGEAAEYDLAG